MEKLTLIWFLMHPLDSEHKSYIILNELKNYQKELKKDKISNTLSELFSLMKDLSLFKRERKISDESYFKLNEEEKAILHFYKNLPEDDSDYINLLSVIDVCLDILYQYTNITMGLLDERNNRIKTFEIVPPGEYGEKPNFGFLFLRNMITDEIFPYYWTVSSIESIKGDVKTGIALKRIHKEDSLYYSLSYVNIAHELIEKEGNIEKEKTPRILICEIEEDFTETSDVIKTAKDNFMNKLSKETNP